MRIVYHCEDVVGEVMAGPGIRAVELSRRLAARHEVKLVAEGARPLSELAAALAKADVFITQGFGFPLPPLMRFSGRLVLDLYDPVQLEHLARAGPEATPDQLVSLAYLRRRLRYLISRADHVLCASRPQRAHWLGWLGACGRLTPSVLFDDPQAERLLALVPFGVPEEPPHRSGSPLRDAIGAKADDRVMLWSGGLWDWMDPALAVRATEIARRKAPNLRLALLAGERPGAPAMRMRAAASEARAAAREGVHFLDRWVPYAERGAWLLDADAIVSAHKPSLEAELAFRTRLLDCLWAARPAACTSGDVLADEGARKGWARLSLPGDAAALADSMIALCDPDTNARARAAAYSAAGERTWNRSAEVLLGLLEAPAPARAPRFAPGMAGSIARKVWKRLRSR